MAGNSIERRRAQDPSLHGRGSFIFPGFKRAPLTRGAKIVRSDDETAQTLTLAGRPPENLKFQEARPFRPGMVPDLEARPNALGRVAPVIVASACRLGLAAPSAAASPDRALPALSAAGRGAGRGATCLPRWRAGSPRSLRQLVVGQVNCRHGESLVSGPLPRSRFGSVRSWWDHKDCSWGPVRRD